MASGEVDFIETDMVLDDGITEQQKDHDAAEELRRIEEDVKREAEQYVEAVDGDGNEQASVEAAATAYDFEQAEMETAMLEGEAEENSRV
ncbi:MAG: BAG1 BAG family molecular chaperone regulator 1 [Gordonibacter sp.]|nr:BAG1 BAG family molecular chaperone regulator 1 [Gordonibacter sp.]